MNGCQPVCKECRAELASIVRTPPPYYFVRSDLRLLNSFRSVASLSCLGSAEQANVAHQTVQATRLSEFHAEPRHAVPSSLRRQICKPSAAGMSSYTDETFPGFCMGSSHVGSKLPGRWCAEALAELHGSALRAWPGASDRTREALIQDREAEPSWSYSLSVWSWHR